MAQTASAFVTGGARGIGRSIVLRLVKDGIPTAFTYVGNEAARKETQDLARDLNPQVAVRAYRLDVKDSARGEQAAEQAIEPFGTVGGGGNHAGILRNNVAA